MNIGKNGITKMGVKKKLKNIKGNTIWNIKISISNRSEKVKKNNENIGESGIMKKAVEKK